MYSFAAHAHLLSLAEKERVVAPNRWTHDLAAEALAYQYAGSRSSFTWDQPALAAMPADAGPLAPKAQLLLDRWATVQRMLDETDCGTPDRVLVDHDADEMTLCRDEPKRMMVIEGDAPDAS